MIDKKLSKKLLSSVHKLIQSTKGQELTDVLVTSLKNDAKAISGFFNINTLESIILSVHLDYAFKDYEVTTERLINHFGKNISAIPDINDAAEELIKKKILFVKRKDYTSGKNLGYNKSLQVYDKVLNSVIKGDCALLETPKTENFYDVLDIVKELICKRIDRDISTNMLVNEVDELLQSNRSLVEIKWLLSIEGLDKYDLTILLNIATEHLDGRELIDIDKIINEVYSDFQDKVRYKRSVKENKCVLFNKSLVEYSDGELSFLNYVQLSEESMGIMLCGIKETIQKKFNPKMGKIITPEKIISERLFYNTSEEEQITTLSDALQQEMYADLISNLHANDMKSGFTVLLHGYPGTGKTSSVNQIAKATGRAIYMVEIEKIQSKWVGESEKNLSVVFDEYKMSKKYFSIDPILLFNEADAILGKRFNVNSSTDKSFNTLQNILLQELEDFEGIFMATTNLANHLDNAFDRRFLYKIEFNKPETAVRMNILKNVFSDITESTLEKINQSNTLTGGQISNIKKKLLVKSLLQKSLNREDQILKLCVEEISLSKKNQRNPIGFHA